jgi:hypothetical protein
MSDSNHDTKQVIKAIKTKTKPNLKYAEVTVIKNVEERTIFNFLQHIFRVDEELIIDKEGDQVLMEFYGEPPINTKDHFEDCRFEFTTGFDQGILYIKKKDKTNTLFPRKPYTNDDGNLCLSFKEVTEGPNKHKVRSIPSLKNTVLYLNKTEFVKKEVDGVQSYSFVSIEQNCFYLIRIESIEIKPRYVVAYDETFFTKKEVIYMVRSILLDLYKS